MLKLKTDQWQSEKEIPKDFTEDYFYFGVRLADDTSLTCGSSLKVIAFLVGFWRYLIR